MATEKPTELITLVAAEAFTNKRYFFVKIDSNGEAAVAGDGEAAVGVAQEEVLAGEYMAIMTLGISKVKAGGTITAGNNVASDASGRAVAAAGDDAILGIALEDASENDLFSVLLLTRTSSGTNSGCVIGIPIYLDNLATGDVVTEAVFGISGKIVKVFAVVVEPTTDSDADATLNLEIDSTNLTGGVITLSDDNMATLGTVVNGTAITAGNVLSATSKLSVETVVTNAFSDGQIMLYIVIQ